MAINLIIGRPGSGKSYESVVYHIIPAVKSGRKVITNVPLNLEHFASVFGDECLDLIEVRSETFDGVEGLQRPFSRPEDFTGCNWKDENGVGPLFVIDECHFIYPTQGRGKKASNDLLDSLEYFSEHRHYGHDILLITQSLGKIHRDLRAMVQIKYVVSKHTAAGIDKTYTQKVCDGAEARATVLNTAVRTYKSRYFPFYKSHTKSDKSVAEAHSADIVPIWKKWYFWLGIPFILIGLPFSISSAKALFSGDTQPDVVEQKTTEEKAEPKTIPDSKSRASLPKRVKDAEHPFKQLTIAITGNSDSSYRDRTGRYHRQVDVYFSATTKSKYVFPLNLQDLFMAGYDVQIYGPCLIRLTYGDFHENIYCEGQKPNSGEGIDLASTFSEALGS